MKESIEKHIHSISMDNAKGQFLRVHWLFLLVLVLAPLRPVLSAQDPERADKGAAAAQVPTQPAQPQPPSSQDDEVKITPRQAEELFHSVDEILEFDSKQTGFPVRHEVKRKLTSRDAVVS
jgi:hypothetical protein